MVLAIVCVAAHAANDVSIAVEVGQPSHGTVSGVVALPVGQALDIIMDCEGTSGWFPDVVGTHLVERTEDGYICSGQTDLPWPIPDRVWSIEVHSHVQSDGTAIATFAYVPGSGNLTSSEGRYVLTPQSALRTKVTYEVAIDPGFWAPSILVEWATRRVLPGILDGLESQGRALLVARN